MSIAAHLAEFAAGLRWEAVPAGVREKLVDHVVDTLGVMCVGTTARETKPAAEAMKRWRGDPVCSVVATDLRMPAAQAAFLNTFHGRIHTYDDTFEAGPIHSGSVILGAALASAQATAASGATLLAGVLAGYEVSARVVAAFGASHYAAGFHTTGTCNVFGATAAAGRIRGLSAKEMTGALGIAGGMASGLRQYQIDGSISDSALNAAHSALAGVLATDLAAAGLSGPEGIIDGKFGLGTITAPGADFSIAARGLGSEYVFDRVAIKPYPTCRFTHGPLQVLAELKAEHRFAASDVERIEIATFLQSIEVSDRPYVASRTEALLSHQTSAALLLVHGGIDVSALDKGVYHHPDVSELARRVAVVHSEELEAQHPEAWPHRITVVLRDGRVLEGLSRNPPGGADNPVPRSAVDAKFQANAGPVLGSRRADALLSHVRSLPAASNLDLLATLLAPEEPTGSAVPRRSEAATGAARCV